MTPQMWLSNTVMIWMYYNVEKNSLCLRIMDRMYADNNPSVIGQLSVDNISRALVKDTVTLS